MLAKERAKIWATDPHFDEKTRKTAAQMLENEEELLSAFGTELAFGTGGLRGVLGIGTNRMNEYTVCRATQGLADYLREKTAKALQSAMTPAFVPGNLPILRRVCWPETV